MATIGLMFGLFAAIAAWLVVVVLRRRSSTTHNADGLLIEQASRIQAQRDRSAYSTLSMHNTMPTMSDQFRRP
ncbi:MULTISPECIES: hypothetical protein [unclassified Streptomyces]|uniref:hypothetical protein n=1 Tax=unclassified Streptomyces TaxID=2593676 RepID=UPI0007DD90E0|nr:hypothetical protein [Streptomyces sp. SAT1]ANH90332.1 hypothetical protein A8713_03560 [Streptomyces sp. SAT1]